MTNYSSDPRSPVANDDRRIATQSAPVGVIAQPFGVMSGAASFGGLDMAAGVVIALMILGPLVCGVIRVG